MDTRNKTGQFTVQMINGEWHWTVMLTELSVEAKTEEFTRREENGIARSRELAMSEVSLRLTRHLTPDG